MIDGVELKPLRIYPDDRGFFMETLRQDTLSFGASVSRRLR